MDLQNIQDQLNTEFAKPSVKYIFWFDDKAEYEEEVSELDLIEAKLHVLDGRNWFYSKWLFYESDPDSKYLIYHLSCGEITLFFQLSAATELTAHIATTLCRDTDTVAEFLPHKHRFNFAAI